MVFEVIFHAFRYRVSLSNTKEVYGIEPEG
jgi:hypothetical protein